MAMSRSLGEGKISKIVKKYAYITDERLGIVYFPISAATVTLSDCTDLRHNFANDDLVVFTAIKQNMQQVLNDCRYVAGSVVKKSEIIDVRGKISEICDKFCYADVKKYGRVFIPYSCRTDQNKPWLGKGAEKGKDVNLKIFRQPNINQCSYVAFGISITDFDDSSRRNCHIISKGAEKQLDNAFGQIGVIITHPSNGDSLIYSGLTGLARLPLSSHQNWMNIGRFVRYDVLKQNIAESVKVHWMAKNFVDLGDIFPVIDDSMDTTKLLLEIHAVINRVCSHGRTAWLWNDFIGRIYVPASSFIRGLKPMGIVKIRALYTGAFDDVPWTALNMEIVNEEAECNRLRYANGQLLQTDDEWVVTTVKYTPPQQQTFYGFMDNPKFGSAFIAWTDLADGDVPPEPGTKCRATVYHQQRDGKHAWRAVLVSVMGSDGQPECIHPTFRHSGAVIMPKPFKPPHVALAAVQTPRSAVVPPTLPALPSPIAAPNRFSVWGSANRISPITKSNDTLHTNGISVHSSENGVKHSVPDSPALGQMSPAPRVMSSDSSDAYSDQNGMGDLDIGSIGVFNHWNSSNEFLPWGPANAATPKPSTDIFGSKHFVGIPTFPTNEEAQTSFTSNGCRNVMTSDTACQTDSFSEQLVLNDILKNSDILTTIIQSHPEHTERLMSLRSLWKS